MRYILILCTSLFLIGALSQSSFCQGDVEKVIYLKNGNVIHDIVLEQVSGKTVKFHTTDRNVYVFTFDEVDSITEEPRSTNYEIKKQQTLVHRASGYINIARAGLMRGEGAKIFHVDFISGARIKDFFAFGLGAGLDHYTQGNMIPVMIDLRSYFGKNQVAPILFADIGYSIGWVGGDNGGGHGGLMFATGAGFSIALRDKISIIMEVGFKLQHANEIHESYSSWWDGYQYHFEYFREETNNNYKFFTWTAGIEF